MRKYLANANECIMDLSEHVSGWDNSSVNYLADRTFWQAAISVTPSFGISSNTYQDYPTFDLEVYLSVFSFPMISLSLIDFVFSVAACVTMLCCIGFAVYIHRRKCRLALVLHYLEKIEERFESEEPWHECNTDESRILLWEAYKRLDKNDMRIRVVSALDKYLQINFHVEWNTEEFCSNLIDAIQIEKDDSVRRALASLIAEVYNSRRHLNRMPKDWEWSELKKLIEECAASESLRSQQITLLMIQHDISGCSDSRAKILIERHVINFHSRLCFDALEALNNFIENTNLFSPKLFPKILQIASDGCDGERTEEHCSALKYLSSLAFHNPLSGHREAIIDICIRTINNTDNCKLHNNHKSASTLLAAVIDKRTKNRKSIISALIHANMWHLKDSPENSLSQIYSTAYNPILEHLFYAFNRKTVVSYIIDIASRLLQEDDWKKRVAALAALNYILYKVECDWKTTCNIEDIADRFLSDSNIAVRYTACYVMREAREFDQLITVLLRDLEQPEVMASFQSMLLDAPKSVVIANYGVMMQRLKTIICAPKGDYPLYIAKVFNVFVEGSPRWSVANNAELENCYACDENPSEVIIRKDCKWISCGDCSCRPFWCKSCFERIFFADGVLTHDKFCPMCRTPYCLADVRLIKRKL